MTDRLPFKLYPHEQQWWSRQDYQAVLDVMRRTGTEEVLEFGPGSSTLALIEGGATRVYACEDQEAYARRAQLCLVDRFPGRVLLHRYTWSDPLSIAALDGCIFDLALIDGPRETTKRVVPLRYALARCSWVLIPTEEWRGDGHPPDRWMRAVILAEAHGRPVEFIETGPGAGAFALVGPA
jgi:hypothetical protein